MARNREPVGWRQFWHYHWAVIREAGWPPLREWITSAITAGVAGGIDLAMTGDWSWLVSVAAGVVAGLVFYALDLARASVRLHARGAGGSPTEVTPWRQAGALLQRFEQLAVDFDQPSQFDLGVYRPDEIWNEKFDRLKNALDRLEVAAESAPAPQYDEYLRVCGEIRDILSAPVQKPIGKYHYLNLSRSKIMDRLAALVERDRRTESARSPAMPPESPPPSNRK